MDDWNDCGLCYCYRIAGILPTFIFNVVQASRQFIFFLKSQARRLCYCPGNADLQIGSMYGNPIQYANAEIGVPGVGERRHRRDACATFRIESQNHTTN